MTKNLIPALVALVTVVTIVTGDIYMHSPRGSNNRLNANRRNRQNNRRLFDSQNTNVGGHNVGEKGCNIGKTEDSQYSMVYFQSQSRRAGPSILPVEWTDQHGCGTDELDCQIVLQYRCSPDDESSDKLRDGTSESSSKYRPARSENESKAAHDKRKKADEKNSKASGLHETWAEYDQCDAWERNGGLFTADRNFRQPQNSYLSATRTRQNRRGTKYGYECPEERDYYPYWNPARWLDAAVFVDDAKKCANIEENSQNRRTVGFCYETWPGSNGARRPTSAINPEQCEENGGEWIQVQNYLEKAPSFSNKAACENGNPDRRWAVPNDFEGPPRPECLVLADPVECSSGPVNRANHNGHNQQTKADGTFESTDNIPITGEMNRYEWRLPVFESSLPQRCVLRIRYNITSYDFDAENTDYRNSTQGIKDERDKAIELVRKSRMSNFLKRQKIRQIRDEALEKMDRFVPITGNPKVTIKAGWPRLQMAINTAQMGRVFQDRSHVFIMAPRTCKLRNNAKIYNLGVRGRRGNNNQIYQAVEYDFVPNDLTLKDDELVHIQWTGSNSHPGTGQGRRSTDRNNLVQTPNYGVNYPSIEGHNTMNMFADSEVVWNQYDSPNLEQYFPAASDDKTCVKGRKFPLPVRPITDMRPQLISHMRPQLEMIAQPGKIVGEATSRVVFAGQARISHDFENEGPQSEEAEGSPRKKRQSLSVCYPPVTGFDPALVFATSGYYWCESNTGCASQIPNEKKISSASQGLSPVLDNASPSFPGLILRFKTPGKSYTYMSSRNNAFSNRSQKGRITIKLKLKKKLGGSLV